MNSVQSCSEIREIAAPKYAFAEYEIQVNQGEVIFPDCKIIKSQTLAQHLCGSGKCAVMAATLGHEVDRILRRLQYSDMAKAVAADECASALVEEICDSAEKEIAQKAMKQGYFTTSRYSPGYGDFSLDNQVTVLELAGIRGVSITEDNLLLPQKSVTAIIGYSKEKPLYANKCSACSSKEKCHKNGKC